MVKMWRLSPATIMFTDARKCNLKCTGIGSHVAFYYWPSALIREYIAIHAEKKHAIMLAAGYVAMLGLTFYMIYSQF